MTARKTYKIIIPPDLRFFPNKHERKIAFTLAEYFKSDIEFINVSNIKPTPDCRVVRNRLVLELKSPTGSGSNTIHHLLSNAKYQSSNIVVDLHRTKLPPNRAVGYVVREWKMGCNRSMKRIFVVTKQNKVIEIPRPF